MAKKSCKKGFERVGDECVPIVKKGQIINVHDWRTGKRFKAKVTKKPFLDMDLVSLSYGPPSGAAWDADDAPGWATWNEKNDEWEDGEF